MARATVALLLILALGVSAQAGAEEATRPYELIEVADGVWAAAKPAGARFDDSNSLVVVGKREILVVDSQADPAAVRALIADIRQRFGQPVRYLVNTHWHPDHTQGNRLYLEAHPDLEIVGHQTLAEDLEKGVAPMHEKEQAALHAAVDQAERILASGTDPNGRDLTADQRAAVERELAASRARLAELAATAPLAPGTAIGEVITLRVGGREVRLLPFRGHTRGDVAVYLPREKVLAAGDLVDEAPYGGDAIPTEWIGALEALQALDLQAVVPGHGAVRRDKSGIASTLELLRAAVEHVSGPAGKRRNFELVMEALDYAAFRERFAGAEEAAARAFDANVPTILERAWLETRGELAD